MPTVTLFRYSPEDVRPAPVPVSGRKRNFDAAEKVAFVVMLAGMGAEAIILRDGAMAFNVPILCATYWGLHALRQREERRKVRRRTELPCPACDYSLKSNTSGTCPECGAEIEWRCSRCGRVVTSADASCWGCELSFAELPGIES